MGEEQVRISHRSGLERGERGAPGRGRLTGEDGNGLAVFWFPCALTIGGSGIPVQLEAQVTKEAVQPGLIRQGGGGRETGADAALDFGDGELPAKQGIPAECQSPHRRQTSWINFATGGKIRRAGSGDGQGEEAGVRKVGQRGLLRPRDGAEFLQDPQWSGQRILEGETFGRLG